MAGRDYGRFPISVHSRFERQQIPLKADSVVKVRREERDGTKTVGDSRRPEPTLEASGVRRSPRSLSEKAERDEQNLERVSVRGSVPENGVTLRKTGKNRVPHTKSARLEARRLSYKKWWVNSMLCLASIERMPYEARGGYWRGSVTLPGLKT